MEAAYNAINVTSVVVREWVERTRTRTTTTREEYKDREEGGEGKAGTMAHIVIVRVMTTRS